MGYALVDMRCVIEHIRQLKEGSLYVRLQKHIVINTCLNHETECAVLD